MIRPLILVALLAPALAWAQEPGAPRSAAEATLVQAWREAGTLDRPLAHAVMAAEAPVRPADYERFDGHLAALFTGLDRRVRDRDDAARKLRAIWRYLHGDVLRHHRADARLSDLFESGSYSSHTGTLLLLLAAERYGVPVTVFETPVHFYLALDAGRSGLLIDVTDPRRGFGFGDPKRVSEHLAAAGLLSAEDARLDPETVYAEVVTGASPVPPSRLVAHTYAMQVWPALEEGRLDDALAFAERAWTFAEQDDVYGEIHALALSYAALAFEHDAGGFAPYLLRALDLRAGDVTFVALVLPLLLATPQQLAVERDFDAAMAIVDQAREALPLGTSEATQLNRVAAMVQHDQAVSLLNRGDIEAAQEAAGRARALAPTEARMEETYVMTTCRLALWRAERGEAEQALQHVTAVLHFADAYPVVRDTYARTTMFALKHPSEELRIHQDDPDEALRLLLQAYEVAPEAPFLKDSIGWAYHELAMARVRARDYVTARSYVDEALRYAPGSDFLQEDYELIDEFERNNW